MSIEENMGRIATALEKIAASQNAVTAVPAPTPAPAGRPRKATPTPPADPTPPAVEPEGTDFLDDEAAEPVKEPTKDDVRKVLVGYQKATNQQFALKLLKKHGADTLGALSVDKYAAIIKEAEELTASKAAPK